MAQAEARLAAHELNGAWEVLHGAVERNPEAPELSCALGLTDYLRGEIADAEMEFKKAIRLNDKFARAWLGLGRVFEAGSLRAKAKICYQKAWKENPGDPEAQRYYARTLAPAARLAALVSFG
jgi:tetratricopeptide (TPR) repeat protein